MMLNLAVSVADKVTGGKTIVLVVVCANAGIKATNMHKTKDQVCRQRVISTPPD